MPERASVQVPQQLSEPERKPVLAPEYMRQPWVPKRVLAQASEPVPVQPALRERQKRCMKI